MSPMGDGHMLPVALRTDSYKQLQCAFSPRHACSYTEVPLRMDLTRCTLGWILGRTPLLNRATKFTLLDWNL